MKRTSRILVTATAFALMASACGGDGDEAETPEATEVQATEATDDDEAAAEDAETSDLEALVSAAQEEGSVTWYSGSSENAIIAVAEAFEEKYGITVEWQRLVSSPLAQRFQTEVDADSVEVDVMSTVDSNFFTSINENGDTVDLTADEVPAMADYPSEHVLEGDAAAVLGIGTIVAAYNTDLVDSEPEGWHDLIHEQYENNIILVDPRSTSAWANVWNAALQDPDLGEQFIEDFADQGIRQVVDSAVPGSDLLAAGEGNLLLFNTVSNIVGLQEAGAPLESVTLQDPAPVFLQYVAMATEAPHPNAARLFMNYVLSEEGQRVHNEIHLQASPLGDLEGTIPLPDGIVQPDDDAAAANLDQIVELLGLN